MMESNLQLAADVILRRKWIALIVFAAALSAAAPFPLALPDLYRATATLLVERDETATTLVRPAVAALDTRLTTIQQEILSRERLIALIERFDLYPDVRQQLPIGAAVERMRRDLQMERVAELIEGRPATTGMTVSYVGADPVIVAQVANAIASRYVEQNTSLRAQQAGRTADLLERELAALRDQMDRQQAQVGAFTSHYADELPEQVGANLAAIERLNVQLGLNGQEVARLSARRDSLLQEIADLETGDDEGDESVRSELSRLQIRLRELETRFTDRYPEVVQVKARIAELEAQQIAARDKPLSNGKPDARRATREQLQASVRQTDAELARLRDEERRLRAAITEYDEQIRTAPLRQGELERLSRDYGSTRELYQSVLVRYQEAKLAERLEQQRRGESFRILDPALPPNLPVAPNRLRLLILVLLLALAAAGGAILLAEVLDHTFWKMDELRQLGDVPVLATIPYMRVPGDRVRQILWRVAVMLAVAAACSALAAISRFVAEDNTGVVWMLARGQV